jgi:hypothetical protein
LSVADRILGSVNSAIPRSLSEQARWQAGVITRKRALDCGVSLDALRWKIKSGAWRQVYPGVYVTFTGPLTRDAQLWAAVLAAGPGAQLSHETAAEIHGLTDRRSPIIHVTIPANRRVQPPRGVAIHLSSHLATGWRFARGIPPHTFVDETIIDLVDAAALRDDVVAYVTGAFARNVTSEERLRKEIAARKRLRWRDDLDEIVPQAAGGTHSVLEYRYDRDVERAHGLPAASKQVLFTKPDGTKGRRDRSYEKYGLIVELDGKRYHPEERRRLDRDRDNDATATIGSTLRYDWDDVTRNSCASAAQVYAALTRRGYTGRFTLCSPTCGARALPPRAMASRAGGSCRA